MKAGPRISRSIAILGEFSADFEPHRATETAIVHSSASLGVEINSHWVSTDCVSEELFDTHAGIWVAPGSPYRNMQRTLCAIRYARVNKVPCIGTCGGFQHMVIEYARNVLNFADAEHAEYDPYASNLLIAELECSLAGREMKLEFAEGSRVASIYGARTAVERYYCNFGVNPKYIEDLTSNTLRVVGSDSEGDGRVLELSDHPFYIGTLFVPQCRSTPSAPHPLVTEFVKIVAQGKA